MYRQDGENLISAEVQPINVTIGDDRLAFCSAACVSKYVLEQDETSLRGGYRLF